MEEKWSKDKKMSKNIGKICIFLVLFCTLMARVISILNYKDTGGGGGWQRFYDMPKGTADVVFFGSSHAHCTFDHGTLWNDYGIAGYTLSAGSQRIDCTYYFVEEAIKVQRPKVVVVDVWGAVHDKIVNDDESVYRNTLGMRWSLNLWRFVNDLTSNMGEGSLYKNRVWFKIPIIHSRYSEIEKEDFIEDEPYMRGYRGSYDIFAFEPTGVIDKSDVAMLDVRSEQYLRKIIQLTKENETELVFVAAPYSVSEVEWKRFNRIAQIAEEESIPMLDYNYLWEEAGLDYSKDFRDLGHLNNYGAAKVTAHIAEFLKANYNLHDRRGKEGYELWDLNSRYLEGKKAEKSLMDAQDISQYFKELSELEEYLVILALTGNHTAAGDSYCHELECLGINYEEYIEGGAWVFDRGCEILRLPGKKYRTDLEIGENSIYLSSENDGSITKIILDKHNYVLAENGINILVYDTKTETIIDNAAVDIYINFDIIR